MKTFLVSFLLILLAVTGMAIGILFGGPERRIRGSCGGIAKVPGMEGNCCGACRRDPAPDEAKAVEANNLSPRISEGREDTRQGDEKSHGK
uniref:(Na+)-NQR maturation NqrM n=1 Tax=Candidatus Kentrum sp. LFY TaxID=2126342 RepID=A0A450UMZ8_9GAMM|nr:MAG: hypothetical protein BECKLFY1418A_GA0070994_103515 [Candidatus Kentron sp. LFY]